MSRRLRFTKMQGLGNDFVVLDGMSEKLDLGPADYRRLADRHFGVGCDQVLVVEAPTRPDVDFGYRIFNADGGEVEQCGNGARCFVQFVRARGMTTKRSIRVETRGGVIAPMLEADGQVTVDMGAPRFLPAEIPFVSDSTALVQPLAVGGDTVQVTAVSMGNPHAVQVVDDVDSAPVPLQGPQIERHARFPQGANAGYMQVVGRANIRLRVWGRCRRDAGMRNGRLRRGGDRHSPRAARCAGKRCDARRHVDDQLGGGRCAGADDRPGGNGFRG